MDRPIRVTEDFWHSASYHWAVNAYNDADAEEWDAFVADSVNGTLMHTRRYIGYHGERFSDRSLVIRDVKGRTVAVLPAALDTEDQGVIVSHPGLTYGGLVHHGLTGAKVLTIISEALQTWREQGATGLIYKSIPRFYHSTPADQDVYALRRLGAITYRTDLSTTIDLETTPGLSNKRRSRVNKAERAGLSVQCGSHLVAIAAGIIADTWQRRHGVIPTHGEQELTDLLQRCPDGIRVDIAFENNTGIAAAISFLSRTCWHTQYLASSPRGFQIGALDQIISTLLREARASGRRWFDFGISTERDGQILNEGLEYYKAGFGGGSTVHEFLSLEL